MRITSPSDPSALLQALQDPSAETRRRAIIALAALADSGTAGELVQCALRHRDDIEQALEIVRSLQRFPKGLFRRAALQTLRAQHPAAEVREAALKAMAE